MKKCFFHPSFTWSQEASSDSITILFGNGTEELSDSFVGLKKKPHRKPHTGARKFQTLTWLKAKAHQRSRTHQDFVSLQSILSLTPLCFKRWVCSSGQDWFQQSLVVKRAQGHVQEKKCWWRRGEDGEINPEVIVKFKNFRKSVFSPSH